MDPDDALSAIFTRSYPSLVGLARLLLDRREEAEEVVQEAFARTLERWRRSRAPDDPYAYVRRAVVNLARSGLRRRGTARQAGSRLVVVDEPATPDAAAVGSEDRREVIDALRQLPQRQRECVVLRYFEECSTAEAADALGISEGAVKTHLHRALAAMEERLEGKR